MTALREPRGPRRLRQIPFRRRGQRPDASAGLSLVGNDAAAMPDQQVAEQIVTVVDTEEAGTDARRGANPVTAWLFQPEAEPTEVPVVSLPEYIALDENFVWVDLCRYAEDDVREVAHLLGLHRDVVYATLSPWHRPSLVAFPDHFLASVTVARLDSDRYRVHAGELDLIAGNNFLISAHKLPLPFHDRLLARTQHSPDLVRLDSAFMLYMALDELLAYYEGLNRHVQAQIELVEESALHDASENFLADLLHFKRYTFALSQLVDQHRELFAAFLRPDFAWVSGNDVEIYFRDLTSRLASLIDSLLEAKDAVNGAFDIYISHMSQRTNQVIKLLTMVSTVLLPATVIIGLFGVSLASSIRLMQLDTPLGFLLMVMAIALAGGGILWIFHRRHWL